MYVRMIPASTLWYGDSKGSTRWTKRAQLSLEASPRADGNAVVSFYSRKAVSARHSNNNACVKQNTYYSKKLDDSTTAKRGSDP